MRSVRGETERRWSRGERFDSIRDETERRGEPENETSGKAQLGRSILIMLGRPHVFARSVDSSTESRTAGEI